MHYTKNILIEKFPTYFIAGKLNVYAKQDHTQFRLLASATDAHPIDVRYISFASYSSSPAQFFYECSIPDPSFDGLNFAPVGKVHPLLHDPELPSNFEKRNCE